MKKDVIYVKFKIGWNNSAYTELRLGILTSFLSGIVVGVEGSIMKKRKNKQSFFLFDAIDHKPQP